MRRGLLLAWVVVLLAGCAGEPPTPEEPAAEADEGDTDDAGDTEGDIAEPAPAEPDDPAPETDDDGADEQDSAADAATEDEAAGTEDEAADDLGDASPRPDWLGTRELPVRPDGLGEVADTPPELVDRRLPPPEDQPRADGEAFQSSVEPVPDDVAARSTWHEGCPVGLDDLRYVTVSFWGFDDQHYLGEMLVHAEAADDLVGVFATLHEARFPIEEMRIIEEHELDLPPTGDGNVTTVFVCRSTVQGQNWSQHAYGLAVDINPFHNPYVRDDVVVPELASAYIDRDDHRPGMIQHGDVVTEAFDAIGWGWGGEWRTALDWMHFSRSGR